MINNSIVLSAGLHKAGLHSGEKVHFPTTTKWMNIHIIMFWIDVGFVFDSEISLLMLWSSIIIIIGNKESSFVDMDGDWQMNCNCNNK